MSPDLPPTLARRAFLTAAAYFVTGRLGLLLPAYGSDITLIWLPTGIAVAALSRWGTACWPGVAIGAFAVNASGGIPWAAAAAIALGNTLGPLLTVWLLRRSGFRPAFERKRDILFLAAAAAVGMLLSATCGVTALSIAGRLSGALTAAWLTWWAGDAMGVIIAAPLALAFTQRGLRSIVLRRGEFLAWAAATAVTVYAVFILNHRPDEQPYALAFVPLPLVAWATLRFGAEGTSLALIALSVAAAQGASIGRGPFIRPDPIESVVMLWSYMATCATLGWLITALHLAQERTAGIRRLLEVALSDVSLGVLLTDLDRRITYVNAGFTRLTGYSEAEMLGRSCAILQGPATDAATAARLRAALHARAPFDGDILNHRKDGTTFWNALLISPVRDESGEVTGFLGVQRDVTESKRLGQKMLQAQKLEGLGTLAGGIAHDFNNILTAIVGHASFALKHLPQDARVRENLQAITDASSRASELCSQMLAYSGKGKFVVERQDLGRLVETTLPLLQLSIRKKALLRLEPSSALPPIEADATQLRQVVMNLVINASEAIGEAGGDIRVATGAVRFDRANPAGPMTAGEAPDGAYVFLEVSDTGCGMPPEVLAHIFDPFFTTKFTGRGLGLAAVLGIVRGHKGALRVTSEVGRGTTFTLYFPASEGPVAAVAAADEGDDGWRGQGAVLVVDDEETVRGTLTLLLGDMGFDVVLARDGREACRIFEAGPDRFALVLLDLTMPIMDGEQTFAALRRIREAARVVVMSGYSHEEAAERFAGKGVASFLQKPFSYEALRDIVRAVTG